MSRKLFITGTGTDIGKTYIAGLIVKKLHESGAKSAYYKAAMSGNVRDARGNLIPGDAMSVKKTAGIDQPVETMCPYVYEHAYSPHLASRLEGHPVRMDVVKAGFDALDRQYDFVTMEGSGGITCPICRDEEKIFLEDIIQALNMPCLMVADAGLGTINNVVLTAEHMRARHIPIQGIIFNHFVPGDVMQEDNLRMCEEMTGLKVLACVGDSCTDLPMDAEKLKALYE